MALSFLANYGHEGEKSARKFDEKTRKFFNYHDKPASTRKDFHRSLKILYTASKPIKQEIVRAATECIVWDSHITVREAELLKVIAAAGSKISIPTRLVYEKE